MRDLFYQEVHNICIKWRGDEAEARRLLEAVERIYSLNELGREQGLLALEEEAFRLDEKEETVQLASLLHLIVEGTDPKVVEEIGFLHYFSHGLKECDALEYLIYLRGCMAMQDGLALMPLEELLLAMLPKEVEQMYVKTRNPKNRKQMEREYYKIRPFPFPPEDSNYAFVKQFEGTLVALPEERLTTLLEHVDDSDLEMMFRISSGAVNTRVLKVLPRERANLLLADVEDMGPTRITDIMDAAQRILDVARKL